MQLLLSKWPLVVVLVLYKPIVWPSAHLPGFSLFCCFSTVWLQPVPAPATCVCNQVSPKQLQQTNSTPPVQPVRSAPLLQPCPFSVPVSRIRVRAAETGTPASELNILWRTGFVCSFLRAPELPSSLNFDKKYRISSSYKFLLCLN